MSSSSNFDRRYRESMAARPGDALPRSRKLLEDKVHRCDLDRDTEPLNISPQDDLERLAGGNIAHVYKTASQAILCSARQVVKAQARAHGSA